MLKEWHSFLDLVGMCVQNYSEVTSILFQNVFCKIQPAGGVILGQNEIGWHLFHDLVVMCVQNVTDIASCGHDLRHFIQNGPIL